MVYVRNDMIQRRRHDIEKCAFNNCDGRIEILSVEVSINKETWLFISTVYVQTAKGTHNVAYRLP